MSASKFFLLTTQCPLGSHFAPEVPYRDTGTQMALQEIVDLPPE